MHRNAVYTLLTEILGAYQIASANLEHMTALLEFSSKGHLVRDKAIEIREAARRSISTYLPAKYLELKHTIKLIREFSAEIKTGIKKIMDAIDSTIHSAPGIGAMIISEIGDFSRFDSLDKILAFAVCSLTTYQSG